MTIPTRRLDALDSTISPERDHEVAAMRDGISNKLRVEQILSLLLLGDIPGEALASSNHTIDEAVADLLGLEPADRNTQKAIEALAAQGGKLIGEPFFLFDNITGASAPDNSGAAKYIRLTAGQSGAGGYNEGLLTNESVSGSAPLVEATAEIATGPLAGQTVPLINTEEAFLRAREASGALQLDQMQDHIHYSGVHTRGDTPPGVLESAISYQGWTTEFASSRRSAGESDSGVRTPAVTSAPLKDDQTVVGDQWGEDTKDTSARTGTETRSKNRSATAYMRIV